MEIRQQKLSEFFNIGRERGWDMKEQRWTVHSLINPEGRVYTLGEIVGTMPGDLRLEKSGNRYGYPPLRDEIRHSQSYDVTIEHVLVTSGTQHANFLAFATALQAGDEAIIESPSWEQPLVLAESLGVKAKILKRRPELLWKFDLNELEQMMSPKVKLIYLCHPNNPTGATLTSSELQAICDIAARHGAYVLSDEIYRGLEWNDELSPAVVNYYERGISTSSISKTLGMGGLRLGWLATQDLNFLERCMELKYYISLHQQSRLDEVVALAALEPTKYWTLVKGSLDAARQNFDLVTSWMSTNDVFSWVPPAGAFLSFPKYDLEIPSWELCLRLLEEPYRTYLVPGSCYGYEGYVRLGFGSGTPAKTIREGLKQIDLFIRDHPELRSTSAKAPLAASAR